MDRMIERYDSALIGILQNEGQITKFLDVIYGFLYRKTDYFLIMKEKSSKMGFPEGTALKLGVGVFKKYEQLAAVHEQQRQKRAEAEKAKALQAKQRENDLASETAPMQCASSKPLKCETEIKEITITADAANKTIDEPKEEGTQQEVMQIEEQPVDPGNECSPKAIAKSADATDKSAETKPKPSGEKSDDEDPELTAQQKLFQMNAESYNGAARDNYTWSQSINDVDVQVNVPRWVCKGTAVQVEISKKHLKACHTDQSGSMVTVLDEDLTWDINKEESMWSLVPGEHIHINLEKVQERWWDGLLENEPKISVRKIDPSRPITDLDGEAQAKIEEMMYNEHQKRLGKPQSHEKKVHDMLRNAWDMEGSPFKGQAFDPSVVSIQNPGDFNMSAGGDPRYNNST